MLKKTFSEAFITQMRAECELNLTLLPGQRLTCPAIAAKLGVVVPTVNAYFLNHFEGQANVNRGAIAIAGTGMIPQWAIDWEKSSPGHVVKKACVPIAANYVPPSKALVPLQARTEIASVNEGLDRANELLYTLPGKTKKAARQKDEIRQELERIATDTSAHVHEQNTHISLLTQLAEERRLRAEEATRRADQAEQVLRITSGNNTISPTAVSSARHPARN